MRADGARRPTISVVVCAFNEERALPGLLESLRTATRDGTPILEVIVVASGCTDGTNALLQDSARTDERLRDIIEPERRGKAAALALGLAHAVGEIIVVENADTRPAPGALAALVAPFTDPAVGFTCARPTPSGPVRGVAAQLGRVLWSIHRAAIRETPKASELYAFRRRPLTIPPDIEDDDAFVGMSLARLAPKCAYVDSAVVYNRVPSRVVDLLRQRTRINRQIVGLWRRTGLRTVTWKVGPLLRATVRHLAAHPGDVGWVAVLATLESGARGSALVRRFVSPLPVTEWEPVASTKGPLASGESAFPGGPTELADR